MLPESCYLHCLHFGEVWDFLLFLAEEEPVGKKPGDERDEKHIRHAEERVLLHSVVRRGDVQFHAGVPHGSQRHCKREKQMNTSSHTVPQKSIKRRSVHAFPLRVYSQEHKAVQQLFGERLCTIIL